MSGYNSFRSTAYIKLGVVKVVRVVYIQFWAQLMGQSVYRSLDRNVVFRKWHGIMNYLFRTVLVIFNFYN